MDYKKKYDEALEKVKKLYAAANGTLITITKSLLEKIFPELHESEDERIRKWLVDYFSSIKKTAWIHRDITCEQILAYLEKQKEQKPAWSEEDETTIQATIELLKVYFKENDLIGLSNLETAISPNDLVKRLKSLRPVKQEWSEKDKYILKNIRDFVKENTINPNRVNCAEECLKWINALPERFNLTPKQEWSEEDKNKIESIKGLITMGRFADTNTIRTIWELLDSLRPSWKPSEEQMKALDKAIPVCAGVAGKDEIYPLISLYEQLLKLIQP